MAQVGGSSWRRFFIFPLAGRTALLCAALLAAPYSVVGLFLDDYHQQLLMERNSPFPGSRWDLFVMAPCDPASVQHNIENGPYLWWMKPTTCFVFVRPLSVLLANVDHWLLGRAFWAQHLHSVAWYLGLVAVATALLKKALGASSQVGALATVLFATHGTHSIIVAWLANRNALVATLPALLGVLAHVHWRESRKPHFLALSLVGYATGLAGGEASLGALAYLAAYEATAAPGSLRTRVAALLPAAALGAGYIWLYRALGAGTHDSGNYVDPLGEPLRYLLEAPLKGFTLLGGLVLQGTPEWWMLGAPLRPVPAGLGMLAVVLVAAMTRRLWPLLDSHEQRGLRWLGLGTALSLPPVLAAGPMSRLLLMASLGSSAVVAVVLVHGWNSAGDRLSRVGARFLAVSTVALGLVGWPAAAIALRVGGDFQTRSALQATLSDDALSSRVMVLVAPDASAAMYTEMVRRWHHKPAAKSWVTISFAPYAHRLTRISEDTLELEVVGGRLLETELENLFRPTTEPLTVGTTVRLAGALVSVVSLERGLPNRVRIHFDENPEASGYTLARFDGDVLSVLGLPSVGQSVELPRAESPLSFRLP